MILTQKTRLLYFGIICIFSVIGLVYFRDILLPLAYSYTFGVFVFPLYRWLNDKRVPRALSLLFITVTFLLISISLIYLFAYAAQGSVRFFEAHASELKDVKFAFYEGLKRFKLESYFLDEKGMDQVLNALQYFFFFFNELFDPFRPVFYFLCFHFFEPLSLDS